MKTMLLATAVVVAGAVAARAELSSTDAARLSSAARVVRHIEATVPADLWRRARCVAVIPDVKKGAFVVGGEYGKGVMSCRAGSGWSAPVFLQLAKGSWGAQIGAEQVDLVLLVMNESGVQKLLRDKVSLGVDASIAAGPVGRQGHVGTDAALTAEILSYSRAQGLFAGIDLSGGVLRPDEEANRDAYGGGASPRRILATRSLSAPTAATEFLNALATQPVETAASKARVRSDSDVPRGPEMTPPPGAAVTAGREEEARARIAEMRATIDRMLANNHAPASPAGTAGNEPPGNATVTVDRAQLLRLRDELDTLAATLRQRP